MAKTETVKATNEWTLAADDAANVAIQLRTQGRLMICILENAPEADAPGLVITGTQTFSASDIPAGSKVYIRSVGSSADAVVMSY
ncbi:hypothetical protein ABDF71_21845 [Ochrobactrum sp. WV_118_8]